MGEIDLTITDGVAVVTLAAAERRNALTPSMTGELLDACDRIDADSSIGAVVLQAEGETFCSGAHLAVLMEAAEDPAHPTSYAALGEIYRAFVRIGALKPPTVAAVRGHAIGAGVNLMLATDLRIVASSARISTRFLRIGLHPGGGHFVLLSGAAGRGAAAAMSLFGEEIDGSRARELGLAWEALPEVDVETRAFELARRAAADPELARAAAFSLRVEVGPPAISWPAAIELERSYQMWSLRRRNLKQHPA